MAKSKQPWRKVMFAADCVPCELCGEPVCPICAYHYSDCDCPGPTQDDEYEYRETENGLEARPIGETS